MLLTKNVCLESKYLTQNFKAHLLRKLKEITKNECTKNYGYILDIIKIVKILDTTISNANSDNVFTVEFEAKTLKPEIGNKLTCKVVDITSYGIFLSMKDKFKILIPKKDLLKREYVNNGDSYVRDEDKTINMNDDVEICISNCKYCDRSFQCYGDLVDE